MNRERLEEIKKRIAAASPGPWEWKDISLMGPSGEILILIVDNSRPDEAFIAHARQDLPDLIAAYEGLLARQEEAVREARAAGREEAAMVWERNGYTSISSDTRKLLKNLDEARAGKSK